MTGSSPPLPPAAAPGTGHRVQGLRRVPPTLLVRLRILCTYACAGEHPPSAAPPGSGYLQGLLELRAARWGSFRFSLPPDRLRRALRLGQCCWENPPPLHPRAFAAAEPTLPGCGTRALGKRVSGEATVATLLPPWRQAALSPAQDREQGFGDRPKFRVLPAGGRRFVLCFDRTGSWETLRFGALQALRGSDPSPTSSDVVQSFRASSGAGASHDGASPSVLGRESPGAGAARAESRGNAVPGLRL